MRVVSYVYDSADPAAHVDEALELLHARAEGFDLVDVAAADSRTDGRREAMLAVKRAVRIGTTPESLFDETGRPDFSAGALVTEAETGRRSLHVGRDAVVTLREDG